MCHLSKHTLEEVGDVMFSLFYFVYLTLKLRVLLVHS
jgi:hypothetical protein